MPNAANRRLTGRHHLVSQDPDAISSLVSAVMAPVRVLPHPDTRTMEAHYRYLAWNDFVIGHQESASGYRLDLLTEPDFLTCFIPFAGSTVIETHGENLLSAGTTIHLVSARTIRRFMVAPERRQISLTVSSKALEDHLTRAHGRTMKLVRDTALATDAESPLGSALANFAAVVLDALQHVPKFDAGDIGLRRCRDAFIDLTLAAIGPERLLELTQRDGLLTMQYVRDAEDYIRHHCHLPIGVTEVAEHVGVSVRSLQYAFQRHRGRTPLQALIGYRLAAARDDIVHRLDTPLAEIAVGWGFLHPGRFASLFRKSFGETPRDLRKRTQRAAGMDAGT